MITTDAIVWRQVLRDQGLTLFCLLLLSLFVTYYYSALGYTQYTITTVPLAVVGVALSILLGFRNNEAYNRYWEARTLWGALVNNSRTLARLVMTLVPPCAVGGDDAENADKGEIDCADGEDVHEFHREMLYRQIAYVRALRCHLRRQNPLEEIECLLAPSEFERLKRERNVPAALSHRMGERVRYAWRQGWLQDFHVSTINDTLTEIINVQGGCERIKNTPVPRGYSSLSHKIVLGYCAALPFGLVESLGYATPLVALLVAFTFLNLDRFALLIEDPFCTSVNGLPLTSLTRTIEINLRQRLGETDLPDDLAPVGGVLY